MTNRFTTGLRGLGLLFAGLAMSGGAARAQTSLLPANAFNAFTWYTPNYISLKTVSVSGQSFTRAIQIDQNQASPAGSNPWDAQIQGVTSQPVAQGDVLLLSFSVRAISPVTGGQYVTLTPFMQQNGTPYNTLFYTSVTTASTGWQQFSIPFVASTGYPAGGAMMGFNCNLGRQSFQISNFALTDYGPNANMTALPNHYWYAGHEPNAAWRTSAAARIEQFRRGSLSVVVKDKNGNPVPGASVDVQQTKNAFSFGSCISGWLLNTGPDGDMYRAMVRNLYGTSVIENDLKWPGWEANRVNGIGELNWLAANGLTVRGHNLIWPSWGNMPSDCQALSASALQTRIDNHFSDELGTLAGKCYEWDVINEPLDNKDVQGLLGGTSGQTQSNGILGNAAMVHWFQNAHSLDPNALLYFNDYDIIEAGGNDTAHQNYDYALAQYLLANGAPLQAMGFESHFDYDVTLPDKAQTILDRFAALPLQFSVTEFDVNVPDEQLEADYFRDFATLVYSNPAFHEFLMWGFWENSHWLPQAAMFRPNWQMKPNALAYADQVLRQWRSSGSGTADSAGGYTMRGTTGDYRITATLNGKTVAAVAALTSAGTTITLNMDSPAVPAVPVGLMTDAGNRQIALNWNPVFGATGYNVKRAAVPGGPYTTLAANVPLNGYTDKNLTNGTAYYYTVSALNGTMESANSPSVSVSPFNFTAGLLGKYYSDTYFSTLGFSRVDAGVNFNWGVGSPGAGVGASNWTARWSGVLTAPTTDTYTFYVNADDGDILWVNGKQVVYRPYYTTPTETSGTIALTAGQTVPIVLEYSQGTGGDQCQMSWSSSTQAKQIVPGSVLSPGVSLSGRVVLDSVPSCGQIITIDFRPTDGSLHFTRQAILDAEGGFWLNQLPAKNCTVAFKGTKWLQRVIAVDLSKGGLTGATVSLPGGDADNNNTVDIADFGLLVNAYGTSQSDGSGSYDSRTDFNNDGTIDIADFGILVNNYGAQGDP